MYFSDPQHAAYQEGHRDVVKGFSRVCYLYFVCTQNTLLYIHRVRRYHFISVCPITYFRSFSVWSAKPNGHMNCF